MTVVTVMTVRMVLKPTAPRIPLMMAMSFNAQCVILNGCIPMMNEKQLVLIESIQARLGDILDTMEKDPFYAPPGWTFENLWNALEALKHA
jgi:hypothetical protein